MKEIRHFHLFCGLGGGAAGFNRGAARVGQLHAKFRCLGGIDFDAPTVRDFGQLAGVPGTLLDLFDRQQYRDFHGTEPPDDWREATPADIRRAAGDERPHIVFTSPPCKGFSGLLSERKSTTARYQALNRLTVRGIWLALEAWSDDPPEFFLLENVPRIANRGRQLLDTIESMLSSYGYAVAETKHDCGELGGLAQSRKRFLLVARHTAKVPPFLYQPATTPLRAVGTVLGRMPPPGDIATGGPMHRLPRLQWKTWVRLAFVEAGKDWRSLNRLEVQNGNLRDYSIEELHSITPAGRVADPRCAWQPTAHRSKFRITDWHGPGGTVTGADRVGSGALAIADPRIAGHQKSVQLGIRGWDRPAGVVTGKMFVGGGPNAVADPRLNGIRHNNTFRIARYDQHSPTVAGPGGPANGLAVADPRPGVDPENRASYQSAGHYGVVPWTDPAGAVTAAGRHDNGRGSVADPRLPASTDRLECLIVSEDETWHRPFTTLELAALQSLVDPEQQLELDGLTDSAWRERIGNAVPPDAAAAIASVMGKTLLLAWTGETFVLDAAPVWVRPVVAAIQCASPPRCPAT